MKNHHAGVDNLPFSGYAYQPTPISILSLFIMAIRYLILALTHRCNLRCAYCYNGDGNSETDMPEAVMRQAIGQASSQKPFHLQLTGGEPTLVPLSIEKAAILARKTGRCRSLGIQTNATCLTPDLLTLFKTYSFQIGVSLDGPPAIHQQQRGMAAETLRGLQQLEGAGIPFRVTTVVTQASAATLDRLVLTLAGFGCVRGVGLDLLVGKGRAGQGGVAMPADPQVLETGIHSMLAALTAVNQRRRIPIRLREQELLRARRKRPVFCHACVGESMAVDPQGDVYPCGQTMGDARFAAGTVWQPKYPRLAALHETKPRQTACAGCALEAICPGDCPSRIHYNRQNERMLVCRLYRTIWRWNCDNAAQKQYPEGDSETHSILSMSP
ncbi:radical SAM/SPASM domain-containing protein [Desulfosarcina ovata subsp. sediminis]|uniref:Radical SAM/SPASM domain-containing protein n=1 Tax=Desulfosarcina ovata subsp. sediminis TaxID=885957 RepID=A0A5K7ZJU7_9BACT|nr:radical SAM protein [Desulfosarcina ovata]BBO82432.1 radical SAM/SPASM domain-containing protein [Desulfosarcina ovata subsp. sediminis]